MFSAHPFGPLNVLSAGYVWQLLRARSVSFSYQCCNRFTTALGEPIFCNTSTKPPREALTNSHQHLSTLSLPRLTDNWGNNTCTFPAMPDYTRKKTGGKKKWNILKWNENWNEKKYICSRCVATSIAKPDKHRLHRVNFKKQMASTFLHPHHFGSSQQHGCVGCDESGAAKEVLLSAC